MHRQLDDVPPAHPGRIFFETVLIPLGMTQRDAARHLMISYPRMNEIIREKRRVTPDTALRFARFTGTLPELWLRFQLDIDLWEARNSLLADEVMEIRPARVLGVVL